MAPWPANKVKFLFFWLLFLSLKLVQRTWARRKQKQAEAYGLDLWEVYQVSLGFIFYILFSLTHPLTELYTHAFLYSFGHCPLRTEFTQTCLQSAVTPGRDQCSLGPDQGNVVCWQCETELSLTGLSRICDHSFESAELKNVMIKWKWTSDIICESYGILLTLIANDYAHWKHEHIQWMRSFNTCTKQQGVLFWNYFYKAEGT